MSNQPIKSDPVSCTTLFLALAVGCCIALPIILCLGVSINESMKESITDTRIDRLFARDGRVMVSRFIVLGHQHDGHWPLVVDDVESTRYLTAAFQHSSYLGYVPHRNHGSTYSFRVESGEGWSVDFWGDVGSDPDSPIRQAQIVALLGSPQGAGPFLALTAIYQPADIGLILGCKGGLMGDPVYYWVPLQEPMPEKLGKAIYSLGQPHR